MNYREKMSKEEITKAYINIATMFGTKPTKELIKSIPKKDLVNVCYRLYEIIEEQERIIYKAIEFNKQHIEDIKNFHRDTKDIIYSGDTIIDLIELNTQILKGDSNE